MASPVGMQILIAKTEQLNDTLIKNRELIEKLNLAVYVISEQKKSGHDQSIAYQRVYEAFPAFFATLGINGWTEIEKNQERIKNLFHEALRKQVKTICEGSVLQYECWQMILADHLQAINGFEKSAYKEFEENSSMRP